MKRLILVAPLLALLIGGSAFADVRGGTASQRRVLVEALTALRARRLSVEISNLPATHGRQRQLIFSGVSDPESQWKAEVAAGVFAAHGFRLTWITDGSGTIRYKRVVGPFAAATKTQVVEAIMQAAHADGVRLDRIE